MTEDGSPRLTPLARRMAESHGLDASRLPGSGFGGRVTSQDVVAHLGRPPTPAADQSGDRAASAAAPRLPADVPAPGAAPTAWMLIEVDLTDLLATLDGQAANLPSSVALLAAVAHAAALALREHPHINAAWAGDAIMRYNRVNLVVCPAGGDAIILPSADGAPLTVLARALDSGDESSAASVATFTVIEAATGDAPTLARIPVPTGQAACLVFSLPQRRLTATGEHLAIRWLASLALVFDHRVLDGAPAGHFLQNVRRRLESQEITGG
jgi:pyruvate/2-oxoglutarate dehydrogenase complex dihydrolipoamide acyltransferase (E2) component